MSYIYARSVVILLLLAVMTLSACSKDETECLGETLTDDDSRPDILVIGDSISKGYAPFVEAALPGYDVQRNCGNAMNTKNGVARSTQWLSQRKTWYAVTFNHGMWDIKNRTLISPAGYERNLRVIAARVKERTARPLFVLTTHVPQFEPNGRTEARVLAYNAIAVTVMNELGIPVIDLYSVSETITNLHRNAATENDVHWTDAGSQVLATEVLSGLQTNYGIH